VPCRPDRETIVGVTQRELPRVADLLRPRRRLESGVLRVRVSWWSIGQSALGGALAWEAAVRVLHHRAPFFAAVAAIVCLSFSVLNRMRRVVEMALGVTIGVGLGDLLVSLIGRGGWQLGVVVLLAMTVALLLDGGALIVNQAALQAVFVAVLPPPTDGYLGRWQDALLGGAVALGIAFVLPADPRPGMRRSVARVTDALAVALHRSADAARHLDPEESFAALDDARATQPILTEWSTAVRGAEEVSRLSPLRRHAEREIAAHRRSTVYLDRAVRNLRVALRRVDAAVDGAVHGSTEPPLTSDLLDRLDDVAGALYTVPGMLLDPAGEGGRRALAALDTLAPRLTAGRGQVRSMSETVVLAQLRSAVVDLFQAAGLDEEAARARLP
jgi:uncharacterized membrane protein YgaE (UPF0421/DUF939 family)